MKRLTKRYDTHIAVLCENCDKQSECGNDGFFCGSVLRDRLAAYEETGLEPEEIQRILGEYGRGMSLKTSCADRLAIIKDVPTSVLREVIEQYQQMKSPNPPLTLEELREMDDADVWVVYPMDFSGEQLIMHALVEFDKESGNVWLTNNLGGRSIFDDITEDGAVVYRRKPEEVEA